jgi:hypothetical protein
MSQGWTPWSRSHGPFRPAKIDGDVRARARNPDSRMVGTIPQPGSAQWTKTILRVWVNEGAAGGAVKAVADAVRGQMAIVKEECA